MELELLAGIRMSPVVTTAVMKKTLDLKAEVDLDLVVDLRQVFISVVLDFGGGFGVGVTLTGRVVTQKYFMISVGFNLKRN